MEVTNHVLRLHLRDICRVNINGMQFSLNSRFESSDNRVAVYAFNEDAPKLAAVIEKRSSLWSNTEHAPSRAGHRRYFQVSRL